MKYILENWKVTLIQELKLEIENENQILNFQSKQRHKIQQLMYKLRFNTGGFLGGNFGVESFSGRNIVGRLNSFSDLPSPKWDITDFQ